MKPTLTLYTRSDCTLCELAEQLAASIDVVLIPKDITLDIELLSRYRDKIPVVENSHGQILQWPFDAKSLLQLLESET